MIVDLYNRVSQLTKTGTAGYTAQSEFNSIIKAKQLTLAEMLIDMVGVNDKADDAVSWLKSIIPSTSDANGLVTLPGDYLHMRSVTLVVGLQQYPTSSIDTEEVDMYRTSPVRGPSLASNDVNWYGEGGNIKMLPETAMTLKLRYFKVPDEATIVLTPSSDPDNDYLTPTVGTELQWPQSVYNLLTYLVLMDYGVELKEPQVREFALYGLNMEMIKNAAKP